MKIIIGSDHAGFSMKEELKTWLNAQGHTCEDKGCFSDQSVDYPDYAHAVARDVESENTPGILLCGSANGVRPMVFVSRPINTLASGQRFAGVKMWLN